MAGRVLGCCFMALHLQLTCVSAAKWLGNINDLKRIQFGQSVPRQGLLLLHWFANQIPNNRLYFNPNADYGSHHYGNFDDLLPQLPEGYHYYTVGNLAREGAEALPGDIQNQQYNDGYNRARIIFRVHGQTIDRVYLTQHHNSNRGSDYDPNQTYKISTNLLRDIRQYSRYSLEQFCSSNNQLQSSQCSITFPDPVQQREDTPSISDTVKWALRIILAIAIIGMIIFLIYLQ